MFEYTRLPHGIDGRASRNRIHISTILHPETHMLRWLVVTEQFMYQCSASNT